MKKSIAVVLALVLIFIFSGCSLSDNTISNENTTSNENKSYKEVDSVSLLKMLKDNISTDNTVAEWKQNGLSDEAAQ